MQGAVLGQGARLPGRLLAVHGRQHVPHHRGALHQHLGQVLQPRLEIILDLRYILLLGVPSVHMASNEDVRVITVYSICVSHYIYAYVCLII